MKQERITLFSCVDIWLILSFIVPFGIYVLTLAPSVTFFDSGEFITAIASLGSAHSPGYPLFLMYAKPFTWLPLGNVAFRVNLATAVSSSLACLAVYLLTCKILANNVFNDNQRLSSTIQKGASLAAAFAFAVTPRLWLQSNHDKPYPLLAFITGVIFILLISWRDSYVKGNETPGYIYVCTFLAGLAMGLHQTVVLLLPAWFVFIVIQDWRIISRIKELVIAISCALFGFSVHLYLPLRATRNPALNWGDARNLEQFLWHFLRKGYPSEPHSRNLALLWEQVKSFNVVREFTLVGAALVIVALVMLWRTRQRDLFMAYLTAVFSFLLVIAGYFNTPLELIFLTEEFYSPLYLLTAVFIGIGLFQVLSYALRSSSLPELIGFKAYLLVFVILFTLPTTLCAVNYYENDQHNNYIAFEYASNSLRSLPQNSIMFTWGDSGAFPLWYLQNVEKLREDVDLPHTPHLVFDWYIDSMPRLFKKSNIHNFDLSSIGAEAAMRVAISENLGVRPVFIDFSTRYSVDFKDLQPIQRGIVYQIRKINEPSGLPDLQLWENYSNRGIITKQSFLDLDTGKAILIYANAYIETGEYLAGINRSSEAMYMLKKAVQIAPEMSRPAEQIKIRYGLLND